MEKFSALLAICAGNSPVTGEFPTQRPVTRSFDVFFDRRMNKRLSKQRWGWWFETPSCPLWRHCNGHDITHIQQKEIFTSAKKTIHEGMIKYALLLHSDAIWRHRSELTLSRVMAWWPMAPSHYLNKCWLLIKCFLCHPPESNLTASVQTTMLYFALKVILKLLPHAPGTSEFTFSIGFGIGIGFKTQCASTECKPTTNTLTFICCHFEGLHIVVELFPRIDIVITIKPLIGNKIKLSITQV